MCTVSYIPTEKGFYLTSNRDEDPLRKTTSPQHVYMEDKLKLLAPIDTEKGGSWIATDNKSKVACILNGAFEKHQRKLPYRKSRGHFVFEAFESPSFLNFMQNVELQNIEPFTLILIDEHLQVLVWDGTKKHMHFLSKEIPHLWSSATLYNEEAHQKKLEVFQTFLATGNITSETILKLHGIHANNSFVLNMPQVKTVSTTQVEALNNSIGLTYYKKAKIDEKQKILR
ncbi:NRDE family protein [Galbibacter sp. PAP.153]|uniref:NRDE family protein n=1 Tax=Galbibacter sp. PAP.153 TaxID=3104623 RepID=UPI00300AE43F